MHASTQTSVWDWHSGIKSSVVAWSQAASQSLCLTDNLLSQPYKGCRGVPCPTTKGSTEIQANINIVVHRTCFYRKLWFQLNKFTGAQIVTEKLLSWIAAKTKDRRVGLDRMNNCWPAGINLRKPSCQQLNLLHIFSVTTAVALRTSSVSCWEWMAGESGGLPAGWVNKEVLKNHNLKSR